jgi:cholesterol transport system auxiliary component
VTVSIGLEAGRRARTLLPLLWSAALLGPFTGSLAGCTGLFHSSARPDQVYFLRATAAPKGAADPGPVAASLRISRPTVGPGLDSEQIVLVQADRRMSFFVASRWAAPTSYLLDMLAVDKLRRSGLWQSVADSASLFPADYVLQVTVRRFEADYTGGNTVPDVHVVLDCIVGKREGREVIASFLAEGSSTATANKLSAVVAAFETAANAAVDSLSTQTLDAVRSSLAHATAEQRKE